MKKYLLLMALPALLFSCKSKKISLADNEKVDIDDFIEFFQAVKLPYQLTDTVLTRRESDSTRIGHKIFLQFIPDTVLSRYFGKDAKLKIYPIGKAVVGKKETYLFIKAIAPSKKIVYVLCFDKNKKFAAAKPLIISYNDPGVSWVAGMDKKYTISITRQRKAPGGEIFYKRDAYVFNDAGVFTLILTESNEAAQKNLQIINPIDTLPHKHKFTGDYSRDKRNFISVRDGKDVSHILFFVHFEKDNGECKGELKGQAKFTSTNVAQYRTNNDPCTVTFSFSADKVSMKELEGCGNHRDIKCFFEGSFVKRKETRIKPAKKKNK